VGHRFFYKNIEGLLHALAGLVRKKRARIQWLKAGEALTEDQHALVRRLGLTGHVVSVGAVGLDDLVRLYNAADALVYPSFAEGFGWPLVEAMACGTPVVCSRRGALAEVTAGAARLVDPEDSVDIAEGIADVLEHEALRRGLVSRGLERSGVFRWDEALGRLRALYQDVAEQTPDSRVHSPATTMGAHPGSGALH
jgi:glycosyltransferase involved in cell wall biosynthesis